MKIRAFDILRLLLHFTLSSANLVLQYYEAITVFENKMSILDPIDTKPADSLVRCAMFCGFGCKTFSFNHDAGLCLTYNTCHILNKTVTKMGWQLYNSLSYRLGEEECKRSSLGYEYTGKVSVTESNRTCQAWNSQTPHEHKDFTNLPENYCRNPDGEPAPWCYTEDPKKRWEICNIPYCGLVEEECKRSKSGYEYTGKVSVTKSGKTCQAWNSQTPHNHRFTSLQENYCRTVDNEPAPWCYTMDPSKRWELCNIPYCVTCPLECVRKNDPKGKKYFGTINVTKTGIPCQRWDSQTPHKHQFDELADHENYCRNPDEDNGPWCYTTNDTQRYDFCPVPHC
nr:plasminogen-like [Crassostrea gigas]